MIKCQVKSLYFEKLGNSELENEDAFLIPSSNEIETDSLLKFAISDGATESSFSKEWAELLVSYFKEYSFDILSIVDTLNIVRASWVDKISKIPLPWYAQQKAQSGAYASMLGLTLDLMNQKWNSIGIGDSNLFIIRNDKLIKSFPITSSAEFGNTPYLLSSLASQNIDIHAHIQKDEGTIEIGDLFILGTDAISAWLLLEMEKNNQPWQNVLNLISGEGYSMLDLRNWIHNKRLFNEIKNDDTTLIMIKIS